MKTSNKCLVAALLLLVGSLMAFNTSLRAEYARGTYKDLKRNTAALNFTNFTEVDVQAASTMSVKIVRGPFGVRLNNGAKKAVKISQHGARLTVALAFPTAGESLGGQDVLTISCPQLRRLTTGGTYRVAGKPRTEKAPGNQRRVRVEGFSGDSLVVRQDLGSQVELANNRLGFLRAEAGVSPGSQSGLRIEQSNRILAVDLSVQHQATLLLEAGGIARHRYQFGDSARVTFGGAGLRNLGQPRE